MLKTYKVDATLQIKIKTEFTDDGSSTSDTLRYLVEEDLQDLGYNVDSVKVGDSYKYIIENLIKALEECIRRFADVDDHISDHLEFSEKYDDMIEEYKQLIK